MIKSTWRKCGRNVVAYANVEQVKRMANVQPETVNTCNLCFRTIDKDYERFLVEGRGKFNVYSELKSLEFNVKRTSRFICRGCIQKLKKRRGLLNQLEIINSCIKNLHRVNVGENRLPLKRPACDIQENTNNTVAKKNREESTTVILQPSTSSPVHRADFPLWPVSPLLSSNHPNKETTRRPLVLDDESDKLIQPKRVEVFCKVKWPSKDKERKLPDDLESLGKMLVRGTYKQIANAVWKNERIKKELTALIGKEIDNECIHLCSDKNPSCLRKTDKESVLSFTMEKFYNELQKRAPLFHSVLSAASVSSRSRSKEPKYEVIHAATAMAAAVCLRSRSKFMIAAQLMITILLYHSNWLVSYSFVFFVIILFFDQQNIYHSHQGKNGKIRL